MTTEARLPTRQLIPPDVPRFDFSSLDGGARAALVGLLLTMADDEFVIGFWDSEWTGIAPMLEEDVAFSSIAQDEIGHARVWYEMIAQLTGGDADQQAFGRRPPQYRHARLLDHPRGDWAFSIARRWLYDVADAIRLDALKDSSFRPLAEVVAKVRREERYHLMHLDAWLRRLANGGPEPRRRLQASLELLQPTAASVLCTLGGLEDRAIEVGILAEPMASLESRWRAEVDRVLVGELGLEFTAAAAGSNVEARGRHHGPDFDWLWNEFTMVYRSDPGAVW